MSSDSWCTPRDVTVPLEQLFGGPVDCDPCSNDRSIVKSRVAFTFGGLHRPWVGPKQRGKSTVYQNDPYSMADAWTLKMVQELRANVGELVRLSMASTSTGWWRRGALDPAQNPRIIFCRRIKFLDPDAAVAGEERMSSRFEPALWYYGTSKKRVAAFDKAFSHVASWSTWGRS